ncbi:MAG TPA: sigma-70 family RNA polymerase sigma factor [Gemmatimonadales bacterium]|nr:sigma-70 family RNA polymerase sigma factor [Gemmatimonadales bacterium]
MSGSSLALELAPDVAAAARGDGRAFARLVEATKNTVASIAFAIVRDAELSHEVAQDVYLAAWRELPRLREATSFLPWLRQTTRNRAHHLLRSDVRRRRRIEAGRTDALLAAAADPAPDALARLMAEEERRAVAEAIDALPDGTREVVILYYREGESVRQVAELLDLSEDAVKQRLSRARARLRASLVAHAKATAPSAAFTAGVLAAIGLATPGVAAALTVGMGKVGITTKAGGGAFGGVPALGAAAGALAGGALGLLGGWLGVVFGARRLLARARDVEERRGIVRVAAASMATTLGFILVALALPRPLPVTIAFVGMAAAFGLFHFVWLPRITARRKAVERAEDPAAFARRERQERRQAILGYVAGLLLGGAAVLASWCF